MVNFQYFDPLQSYLTTMIHEALHALGFSSFLFPKYVDPNTGSNYDNFPAKDDAGAYFVNSPKALKLFRDHFGCQEAAGIPLEAKGGSGSVGSHWEDTVMYMDTMMSYGHQGKHLTDMTISLLEDSGWYMVDYDMVFPYDYNKNIGCDFIKNHNDCSSTDYPDFFCDPEKFESPGCKENGFCN